MRQPVLIIFFLSNFSFAFGQSKLAMIGEYKHSVFMYSYKLTLKDTDNFEIEESSDLGSEKTIGTWTIRGQAIMLTAKTKITTDVHKRQEKKTVADPKDQAMVIETKDVLKPIDKDFKLERVK